MPEIDDQFLSAAAQRFEQERGVRPSAANEDIASKIWSALDADLPEGLRSAAYWALGKRCRKDYKQRFVAALQSEICRSSSVSYQIMIALEDLDEHVFSPERSGASILEAKQNIADAERYLAQAQ